MQVLALNEIATPAAAGSLANSVFQLFATKPKPKPTKQTYETGFCEADDPAPKIQAQNSEGGRGSCFSGSCRIPRNVQFQNNISKPLDTTFKQCYEARPTGVIRAGSNENRQNRFMKLDSAIRQLPEWQTRTTTTAHTSENTVPGVEKDCLPPVSGC